MWHWLVIHGLYTVMITCVFGTLWTMLIVTPFVHIIRRAWKEHINNQRTIIARLPPNPLKGAQGEE